MKKKALLALLLAMTLLLSSCALIVKDKEVDAKTVVLKLGDDEVTKAEAQNATSSMLYQMYQYSSMFGQSIDVTDSSVIAEAQSSAISQLKSAMVRRAKAKELGLDQLTEEELAEVKENAQAKLEEDKETIKEYYLSDEEKALEGDALEQAIQAQMEKLGVSLEEEEKNATETKVFAKLRSYVIDPVTVPDEDVKADYDSKVAADEEKYKEDVDAWISADQNGTKLYYTPAGIRRVKQILIKFKADDQTAIDDANSKVTDANNRISEAEAARSNEEATDSEKTQAVADLEIAKADLEAAQAELKAATDAAFANLDADADAVLEALKADPESWDQLQEEKNEDPGMKPGATNAEKGYAIAANMSGFDPAFVEAAMGLAAVGDVSDKTRGESYGYYIIKYVGDEAEGAIDYESVKETLHSNLLTTKQNDTYDTTLDQWISEAKFQEDLNALKD